MSLKICILINLTIRVINNVIILKFPNFFQLIEENQEGDNQGRHSNQCHGTMALVNFLVSKSQNSYIFLDSITVSYFCSFVFPYLVSYIDFKNAKISLSKSLESDTG